MATLSRDQTMRGLNELLRGELAALETYEQVLSVVTEDEAAAEDLRECQQSHRDRIERLRMEIVERGGHPDTASGAWGAFAKVVEGSAKTMGPKMAVKVLEAGEDHGMKEYEELLPSLDGAARDVVSTAIYPQQVRTHRIISALKHRQEQGSRSSARLG
jgi:demethoxyubiquinone hydroxylase (CLK1/Coq7/Cat5 family)